MGSGSVSVGYFPASAFRLLICALRFLISGFRFLISTFLRRPQHVQGLGESAPGLSDIQALLAVADVEQLAQRRRELADTRMRRRKRVGRLVEQLRGGLPAQDFCFARSNAKSVDEIA